MNQNYANANGFFSYWKMFLRYPGYAIWKLTSRAFWKCGGFCCYNLLNHCYGCSKMGPHWRKKFFQRRRNKKLTLSSYGKLRLETNNSGSKMFSNKNHHIFRKTWTSAFRWHTTDKFSNLRKKRLRLHSFGPFWTISTENQWEISEVGRLSCFIEFFVWFHNICDRYTSENAHFTFSPFDHFHFHGSGGLILWYDLRLWRILALHASSNSQILCGWTLWGAGFCYRLWQNTEQNTGRGWAINILG